MKIKTEIVYFIKVLFTIHWMLFITFTCPIILILYKIKKTKFIVDKLEMFSKKIMKWHGVKYE